jgi:hypothetical protein
MNGGSGGGGGGGGSAPATSRGRGASGGGGGGNGSAVKQYEGCDLPLAEWSPDDVVAWLRWLHLDRYVDTFVSEDVDGRILVDLSEEELESDLKMASRLHRRKLLKALDDLLYG